MKYIIDRFENDYAIVELADLTTVNIPRIALPADAKEGDTIAVTIDAEDTQSRQKRIEKKMENLFDG